MSVCPLSSCIRFYLLKDAGRGKKEECNFSTDVPIPFCPLCFRSRLERSALGQAIGNVWALYISCCHPRGVAVLVCSSKLNQESSGTLRSSSIYSSMSFQESKRGSSNTRPVQAGGGGRMWYIMTGFGTSLCSSRSSSSL